MTKKLLICSLAIFIVACGAKQRSQPVSRANYGNPAKYKVLNKEYRVLPTSIGYKEQGIASWYGADFHGKPTSSGPIYDMHQISAAHKTLPIPTTVKVTNLQNGKSLVLKINDRGPFHDGRIIDLSYAAAKELDIIKDGTAKVEVEAIADGNLFTINQFLQLGAFGQETNAKLLVNEIQKVSSHPVAIHTSTDSNKKLFHVRVGPLKTEEDILEISEVLSNNGFPPPIPVQTYSRMSNQ